MYYWAVLRHPGADGDGAAGNPLQAAADNLEALRAADAAPPGAWRQRERPADVPVELRRGRRRYRLQVSNDPSFGTVLDDVQTAATAYTSDVVPS